MLIVSTQEKQFTLMKGYIVLKMSALKFLYGGKLTYYITVVNSTKFSFNYAICNQELLLSNY